MYVVHEWNSGSLASLSVAARTDLDALGVASGEAQFLKGPITTTSKMLEAPDHVLITVSLASPHEDGKDEQCSDVDSAGRFVGYLKFGLKNLYFYHKNGKVEERNTVSLLDFYVSDALQRSGLGLMLFERFLALTKTEVDHPCKVAYDRPSPKLLSFLSKHFSLNNPDAQPNRYTIFEGFL